MNAVFYDLLRHGLPVGGYRYRGQKDDPLSERGWAQMWSAVGDECPWQRVVTSPLSRCRDFAYALGERHGVPVYEDPRLKEVRFGVWEGRTALEIDAAEPGAVARFRADPVHHRPAGAEPLEAFATRVAEAWQDWAEPARRESTLVVTHAGVVRAVLAEILGIPLERFYRLQVANAGLTRIRVSDDRPATVIFHGGCLTPGGEG